jgi:hypothetical protein
MHWERVRIGLSLVFCCLNQHTVTVTVTVNVCIYVRMYVNMNVCVHVSMYVMYICMYACMFIFTNMHTRHTKIQHCTSINHYFVNYEK